MMTTFIDRVCRDEKLPDRHSDGGGDVGKASFAALNLVQPMFPIVGAIGMMIGTGGTAIVGITLGQKKNEQANAYFSMFVYAVLILGVMIGIVGFFVSGTLTSMLGAKGEMLTAGTIYSKVLFIATPFFLLQHAVQSFFVMAEKPQLGFAVTVLGGVLNMVLDPLFIIVFDGGILGAALATSAAQAVTAIVALIYFARPNDSLLHLTLRTRFYGKIMLKACANGLSEMVTNLAYSVVTILYNFQLLKYHGEDGVAAFGVLMYLGFIFSAVYYGYSMGVAPIFSYQYGAHGNSELQNVFRKSLKLIAVMGVVMLLSSELLAGALSRIFVGYDENLYHLTVHAMRIYAISFLFSGFAAFGSSFFTAFNNGLISAAISFLRTLVFETGSILLLPLIIGKDGIWVSIIVAEVSALLLTAFFMKANGHKYGYLPENYSEPHSETSLS